MMLDPAIPQPAREQAALRLEIARRAEALHAVWEAWRQTMPDPAEIERLRAEIGALLSDHVSGETTP
jgi:hypothetical protein